MIDRKHQKRLEQAYVKEWQPVQEDAGTILEEVALRLLQDSFERLQYLMAYHQSKFYDFFPHIDVHKPNVRCLVQFQPSAQYQGKYLRQGTKLYLQSDTLLPLVLDEDIMVQHISIHSAICFHPQKNLLYRCHTASEGIPLFDESVKNEQQFSFSFTFYNCFTCMDHPIFDLYFIGRNDQETSDILDLFLSKRIFWQVYINQELVEGVQIQKKGEHLQLCLPYHFTVEDHSVRFCLQASLQAHLPHCILYDLYLCYPDKKSFLNGVVQNDMEQRPEKFPLFDTPLTLLQSTYIRCDEVFSRIGSTVTWKFQMEELLHTVMPELIEEKKYQLFMRKLPKEQIVYEVFADRVQLEYFNGEWCSIPKSAAYGEFAKGKQRMMNITFSFPEDALPYALSGVLSYWIRITLVKSDNCYLFPSIHHIPILSKNRLSYHYKAHQIRPTKMQYHGNGEQRDLLQELDTYGEIHLFEKRKETYPVLYLNIGTPSLRSPLRMYVTCRNSFERTRRMNATVFVNQEEETIEFEDHTGGFMHSGLLAFYFPVLMSERTEFGEHGCWIKLGFPDGFEDCQNIEQLRFHCASASYKNTQEDYMMFSQDEYPFIIHVNQMPNGIFLYEAEGENHVWRPWQIVKQPNDVRQVLYKDHQLYIPYASFHGISLVKNTENVKIVYERAVKTQQIGNDSTLFLADGMAQIKEVKLLNHLIMTGVEEDEDAEIARLQHRLLHKGNVISCMDIEQQLLDYFLQLHKVKAVYKQGKSSNLQLYVYWRHAPLSVFQHELHQEVKDFLASLLAGHGTDCEITVSSAPVIWVSVYLKLNQQVDHQIQKQYKKIIHHFFHMDEGGMESNGWQLGVYPSIQEFLEYMIKQFPETAVSSCQLYGKLKIGSLLRYEKLSCFTDVYGCMRCETIEVEGRNSI